MICWELLWFLPIISFISGGLPPFLRRNTSCLDSECLEKEIELELISSETNSIVCKNVYEYSCAKWIKRTEKPNFEPFWNNFLASTYKINHQIQKILEQSSDPILQKPKAFYNACINSEKSEIKYLANLKLLVEYFKGWPIVNNSWRDDHYNWMEQITEITKILGIHPILKFSVNIDYKNTSRYSLYIEPGNLIFPQQILQNPQRFSSELRSYKKWIFETILHLYPNHTLNKQNLKLEVLKIVDFEIKLAKLLSGKIKNVELSVEELSRNFKMNFLKILNNLYSEMNVKIWESDTVVIKHYNYFQNLLLYLKIVNTKTIANYLVWAVVKDLSRETTKYMRNLNFSVDKAILGVASDFSRKTECQEKTTQYFSYSILHVYLNFHFDRNLVQGVEDIARNIQTEFVDLIKNNKWLSERTRLLALEKVKVTKLVIGYPKWTEESDLVNKYYENVNITDDHLLNVIMIKNFKMAQILSNIDKSVPEIVAAYNYGRIGCLIGHELAHALDTSGRQANQNGVITKWWTQKDIDLYRIKTKCFAKQYGTTNLLNIGENIADNVGLEISYRAFQKVLEKENTFSKEKNMRLFFITYAQMWCEISEQNDLFSDEHTSAAERVNQAIFNNMNFSGIFYCKDLLVEGKDESFPKSICKLW